MNGSGPHDDLYQMLAYCTVLGLPLGRLVYAAGDEEPIQHAVRRAETIIETTTLDLSKPIPELLSDVAGLAERIAATSSTPAAGAQLCGPFEVITLGRYSLEDWKGYVLDGDGQAVQAEDLGRYPPEQEAAVYFCSLEALQNIAKYARATRATVRLEEQDGHLTFEVTDDGAGFDTTHISYGTGLQGMADRLAAVGGTLDVRSQLGAGTTILGRLPVPALSHGREHPTGRSGTGEQGVSG